jgi:hypothetical protein
VKGRAVAGAPDPRGGVTERQRTGDSDRNLSRGKASPVPTSLANFGNEVARLCILDYAGDDEQQMDAGTVCHGEDEGAVK